LATVRSDRFFPAFVVFLTQAASISPAVFASSTFMQKGVGMTEYYLTAAIIVILALAVMFIISKVQQ
jgi:hypothetical protein